MRKPISRRTLLVAGGGAAIVVVGGGAAGWLTLGKAHSPETEAADFVKLLADVHDDYVNGRVTEYQGWVLSQHEYDTLGDRQSPSSANQHTVS